jgi:hypothetical protein
VHHILTAVASRPHRLHIADVNLHELYLRQELLHVAVCSVNFLSFELLCKTWYERKFIKLVFSVLKGKIYQKTLGNKIDAKSH